jgi:hypothetical protein
MRRILLVMSVALVMAAVMVVSALPVLADPPPNKRGQFTCYAYDPTTGFYETVATNVPQGQVAQYTYGDPSTGGAFGACYRNS